jgi:hypothetical protein
VILKINMSYTWSYLFLMSREDQPLHTSV